MNIFYIYLSIVRIKPLYLLKKYNGLILPKDKQDKI